MHSRYIPTTASATPIQVLIPTFLPRSIPRSGTIRIYSAVINPAFPADVYLIPICCREVDKVRITPQHKPPISNALLFFTFVLSAAGCTA